MARGLLSIPDIITIESEMDLEHLEERIISNNKSGDECSRQEVRKT
jgi:hypothetical protein